MATGVAIVVVSAVVSIGFNVARQPSAPPAADRGLSILLAVEPFQVGDSVPETWESAAFADSLASRLSMVRGIRATANTGNAQFVLSGKVSMKEGRLILATRIGREGGRDTVWTATFWRSATTGSSVLPDLASAVAEAVLIASAHETLKPKGKEP